MPANYPSSVASFPTRITGNTIPASDHNGPAVEITAIETALLEGADHILQAAGFQFESATTKVLASDTLTISGESYVSVDTQGAAATDTLSTISSGSPTHGLDPADGFLLMLKPENASHVVTVTTGGNILLSSDLDMVFTALTDRLLLQYDGTNWIEICRSPAAVARGIDTDVDGKPKITNYAGTSGVVLDVNTDGTVKVYQRDGSTLGTLTAGTVNDSVGSMATLRASIAAIPTDKLTLLKAGSGTSTAATATILDSCAMSGLTVLDQLVVSFYAESVTQDTASVALYNSTDSVQIIGGNFTAGGVPWEGPVWLQGSKRTATDFLVNPGTNTFSGRAAVSMSTAWTGSWTLAFRHGGVTAGGTLYWKWAVYKIAGQ